MLLHNANIVVAQPQTPILTYHIATRIPEGSIVRVPLKNTLLYGIVHSYTKKPSFQTKEAIPSGLTLSKDTLTFLTQMAHTTLQPYASFLALMLSHATHDTNHIVSTYTITHNLLSKGAKALMSTDLSETSLSNALDTLGVRMFHSAILKGALSPHNTPHHLTYQDTINLSTAQDKAFQEVAHKPFALLEGVTGSGKTEVYLKGALKAFQEGLQVLIITPTISLAEQTTKRIKKTLGISALRWHSLMGEAYKKLVWTSVVQGHPQIIVGARSALSEPWIYCSR